MTLYVSNLSFGKVGETELRDLFEQYGKVVDVRVIRDRETDLSRGFGFVQFQDSAEAERAMAELHHTEFHGRQLWVTKAKERQYGRQLNT
jgi:RNA recognition motif-containing protein